MIELDSLEQLDLSAYIRPGDGIVFGQGTGEPLGLTQKLVSQRADYSGAGVFFGAGFSRNFAPEHADHLRFKGTGGIGTLRKLASAGVLDPIPCHISSVEGLLREGIIRSDVVMLLVSPPNERGEYSFGLINDFIRAAIEQARVLIVEVSPHVPWTFCDQPLQASEITVAVKSDTIPLELPTAPFGELEKKIASHLEDYIPDRSTLQVGIGAVPEAILAMLGSRRDLGIHSGMVGDSVVDLIEKGVITNAHKGIDPGVSITGALFGTQRLYRFADRNPLIRLCPTSYTHHASTLSKLKRLISLNSALEVDLTGQVNAEAIGSEHIGAVGGQVDFVRASALTGGTSIIAFPAMGRRGDSKVVAALSGPVTTARSDVDLIVTEYGVAHLRGRTLRERAKAMISIAAPEHREALTQQARTMWREL